MLFALQNETHPPHLLHRFFATTSSSKLSKLNSFFDAMYSPRLENFREAELMLPEEVIILLDLSLRSTRNKRRHKFLHSEILKDQ